MCRTGDPAACLLRGAASTGEGDRSGEQAPGPVHLPSRRLCLSRPFPWAAVAALSTGCSLPGGPYEARLGEGAPASVGLCLAGVSRRDGRRAEPAPRPGRPGSHPSSAAVPLVFCVSLPPVTPHLGDPVPWPPRPRRKLRPGAMRPGLAPGERVERPGLMGGREDGDPVRRARPRPSAAAARCLAVVGPRKPAVGGKGPRRRVWDATDQLPASRPGRPSWAERGGGSDSRGRRGCPSWPFRVVAMWILQQRPRGPGRPGPCPSSGAPHPPPPAPGSVAPRGCPWRQAARSAPHGRLRARWVWAGGTAWGGRQRSGRGGEPRAGGARGPLVGQASWGAGRGLQLAPGGPQVRGGTFSGPQMEENPARPRPRPPRGLGHPLEEE